MKSTLKFFSLLILISILITSCKTSSGGGSNSSNLTGWNFNDPNYGSYIKGKFKDGNAPPGMAYIEGGTYTMGLVQDDVMFDWNTTPRQMHVRSFYMDESEVTNSEYGLFLQYTKDIFPPEEARFKEIYKSILPDTLVWRKSLGNTNLLSENYLRHPAYADYPVVGVSWIQANKYCKWRTNAVNLKILMDKGVIKNIFKEDSLSFKGKNNFDTDAYLTDAYALFDGDSTIYKKGMPVPRKKGVKENKDAFGRHVTSSDGILSQKFRLPTEVEWEYAAKAVFENREYNNIRGRKKYSWSGKYTRNKSNANKGDQLANFKQGQGNYSGISGWSSDGADIPNKIKSYPPNAFGLYDMSGNVAEWVSDVYRPIVDSEANDFNYFRGNIYTKKLIDENGKVVIVGDDAGEIEYDTLVNGRIVPKDLPGSVKFIPITRDDTFMRRNYLIANNSDVHDGDQASTKLFELDKEELAGSPRMYNSPRKPEEEKDSLGNVINKFEYDKKRRTTLISNKTRVFKGGSWADREYWLDPAQRRYFPQYISTNYIGFRCATDKVGPLVLNQKKTATPKYTTRAR